ncbi:hypothetical protein, partial [Pseudomonas aeruginosa]|uniref:hypothetical protein n=1 Tax=Pseudomonas aeruginosa TaxID=287 RepID=UPI001CA56E2E
IHQFKQPNPGKSNLFVWTPKVKGTPYVYKCCKLVESIYSIIFNIGCTENDGGARYTEKMKKIDKVCKILDILFEQDLPDYGNLLRTFFSISAVQDIYLVTDRGVRPWSSMIHSEVGAKGTVVFSTKENADIITCFNNMVHFATKDGEMSYQEALDKTSATCIFGEYYYAQTPTWWTDSARQYNTKEFTL